MRRYAVLYELRLASFGEARYGFQDQAYVEAQNQREAIKAVRAGLGDRGRVVSAARVEGGVA